jgi:hypothetical protein
MQNEYWLNGQDTIIAVGATWDSFADENEGHAVVSGLVVGRSLWDFIAGDPTRMWLSSILTLARIRNQPVSRPYRCDSATVKRFMNLVISKEGDDTLHLEHTLVRIEPMSSPRRFTPALAAGKKTMQRCSVCNRLNTPTGWTEAENLGTSVGSPITVIYAVCSDCMRFMSR